MASQSRLAVTPEWFARSTIPPLFTAFSFNIALEVSFDFFPTLLLLFHLALRKVALRIIVQKGNVWQRTTVGIWYSKLLFLCWSLEGLSFVAGGKNVPMLCGTPVQSSDYELGRLDPNRHGTSTGSAGEPIPPPADP